MVFSILSIHSKDSENKHMKHMDNFMIKAARCC